MRNEETGQTGAYPVTALMSRTSPEQLWLTLEDAAGVTSRLGVTSEHPLFVAGQGWVAAGDVAAGDALRDADLQPLQIIAVEVDPTPTKVHNLEVAEAQTYFAGELEAWGHNLSRDDIRNAARAIKSACGYPAFIGRDVVLGWATGWSDAGTGKSKFSTKHLATLPGKVTYTCTWGGRQVDRALGGALGGD